jgi:hypothetical protein
MIKTHLLIVPSILLSLFLTNPLYATFDSSTFNQEKPLALTRIKPTGKDVPAGRQIVFQFNQPVVPVGKMERDATEIPITIEPTVLCQWRWLNTSALACQLGDKTALQSATRYQITIKPGIKTENGKTLSETVEHTFITQRPAVKYARFKTWRAPGMPYLRISFNQPVTQQSVTDHLYFQQPDAQRMGAIVQIPVKADEENEENEDNQETNTTALSKVWIVAPEKLLPLDTTMTVHVEPGLVANAGTETGVEKRQLTEFHTFPKFEFLGIECTDLDDQEVIVRLSDPSNLHQRCNPMRQVALVFSSPVIKEVVEKNLWLSPDLAGGRKDYNPWERLSSYSELNSKHSKAETYKIWLPELLKAYESYQLKIVDPILFKDEFGRALSAPVEMSFVTDHRPPNYVFEHQVSVLEKGVDSEVPIFVTNLQKIDMTFRRLTESGWSAPERKSLPIFKV